MGSAPDPADGLAPYLLIDLAFQFPESDTGHVVTHAPYKALNRLHRALTMGLQLAIPNAMHAECLLDCATRTTHYQNVIAATLTA